MEFKAWKWQTIDEDGGLDDFCVQSPNDEEIIWFK